MIFRRLFTPKYQDPNPTKRIQAIARLSLDNPAHKAALHELAFNDASADVSLAALRHLNSFPLWLKMSEIARDAQVQKASFTIVKDALTGVIDSLINDAERRAVLCESKDKALIRIGLLETSLFANEPDTTITLLNKLNDESVSRAVFACSEDLRVRQAIIEQCASANALKALKKVTKEQTLITTIDAKIDQFEMLKARPNVLQKALTLNLSKLQALLEKSDYRVIKDRQAGLCADIAQDLNELNTLDSESSAVMSSKFDAINARVDALMLRLEPEFRAQQAERERQAELTYWQQLSTDSLNQFKDLMNELFHKGGEKATELNTLRVQLDKLIEQAQGFGQFSEKQQYLQQLTACLSGLDEVPEIISHYREITEAIATFDTRWSQSIDTAVFDDFNAELMTIQTLLSSAIDRQSNAVIKAMFNELRGKLKQWKSKAASLRKSFEAVVSQCKQKCRVSSSLIKQGRFNAAIAIYQEQYPRYLALPLSQQQVIANMMQQWLADIEELQDWQSYVAAPRKPELLAAMEALAEEPMADAGARKRDVVRMRKDFASLGRFDNDEDIELNNAFDCAAQRAYEPAEKAFVEQKQRQQQRAKTAESVLLIFSDCGAIEDDEEFLNQLSKAQKQWRNIGEMSHADYKKLKRKRDTLLTPLTTRANDIYQRNNDAKQALIDKAHDIVISMPDDAKTRVLALQQEWKALGFAGFKRDQQLWNAFRRENDAVFDALKAKRTRSDQTVQEAYQRLSSTLDAISTSLENASTHTTNYIQHLMNQSEQAEAQFLSATQGIKLAARTTKDVKQATQAINAKLNRRKRNAQQERQVAEYRELFSVLAEQGSENAVDVSRVKRLSKLRPSANLAPRRESTVRLEIRCGVATPKDDAELRQSLHMKMMQEKLQKGDLSSIDQLLVDWIGTGVVSEDEQRYLQRVEKAVLSQFTSE